METLFFILLIALGFFIGFIGAFVGVGGGILLLLVFIFLIDGQSVDTYQSARIIIANTAFVLLVLQLVLAMKRIVTQKFYVSRTVVVSIPGILATLLISYFIVNFPIVSLGGFKILFIVFVTYSSYVLVSNKERRLFDVCHRGGIKRNFRNLFAGFISGTTTSLTGSDSGIFIVPVLNRYCDIDIRKAVNIYNSSLLFILLSLVLMYVLPFNSNINQLTSDYIGYIYIPHALPLSIGASAAALPGYALFKKFKFNYFVYPLVFIFAITVLRILFLDFIFPLYR
jgi:uncharacterized membrane protein YfcA